MNILFFTHHLVQGGAEKTVRTISQYINDHFADMKAYVCVVYDAPEVHDQISNVIVMKNRSCPEDSQRIKAMNVCRQIAEMKQIKRQYVIDVCISFLPGADIINVLSDTGEKKIVSVRNRESYFVHSILKKWYVECSYKRCDAIAAVSEVVRRDTMQYFGVPSQKVTTIHNAIIKAAGDENCETEFEHFTENKRIIFNVGRLSIEKGQHFLIRAFAAIAGAYPDVCLVILGEGEERKKLETLIRNLNLQDRVLLAGHKSNPSAYLRRGELFVLSSTIEGMPNVLLEAMQAGLPVLSTECGAREILAPETDVMQQTAEIDKARYGILIPTCADSLQDDTADGSSVLSGREKILADSMQMLLDDPELQNMYRKRNAECLQKFSLETIAEQWMKLITDVTEGNVVR